MSVMMIVMLDDDDDDYSFALANSVLEGGVVLPTGGDFFAVS